MFTLRHFTCANSSSSSSSSSSSRSSSSGIRTSEVVVEFVVVVASVVLAMGAHWLQSWIFASDSELGRHLVSKHAFRIRYDAGARAM